MPKFRVIMERTITVSVELEVPTLEHAVQQAPGVFVDGLQSMTSVKWEGGLETVIERVEKLYKL